MLVKGADESGLLRKDAPREAATNAIGSRGPFPKRAPLVAVAGLGDVALAQADHCCVPLEGRGASRLRPAFPSAVRCCASSCGQAPLWMPGLRPGAPPWDGAVSRGDWI